MSLSVWPWQSWIQRMFWWFGGLANDIYLTKMFKIEAAEAKIFWLQSVVWVKNQAKYTVLQFPQCIWTESFLLDSLGLFCRHHAPVYKASSLWHHQRCVSQTQTKWATEDYKHDAQTDRELCVCVVSAAQLEFVQILVIVVVMMVMVVVITCLLNHYRLSARSLLSRHAPARRRHLPLANVSPTLHSHSRLTFVS